MRRAMIAVVFGLVMVIAGPSSGSTAAESCPEAARTLNAEVQKVLRADPNDQDGYAAAYTVALADRPDCERAFRKLHRWYVTSASGDRQPFPFSYEERPRENWAGPIGWWWNQIYHGLLGSNTLLMWLFGWELFIGPIALVLAWTFALLSMPFRAARRSP